MLNFTFHDFSLIRPILSTKNVIQPLKKMNPEKIKMKKVESRQIKV